MSTLIDINVVDKEAFCLFARVPQQVSLSLRLLLSKSHLQFVMQEKNSCLQAQAKITLVGLDKASRAKEDRLGSPPCDCFDM